MKAWVRRTKYKLLRHFIEVLRSQTSDKAIAFGFATGSFIALLPTPGLNWVLAFLAALIYRKLNKLSLFFAIVFWNPLFLAPVYALCYVVGDFVFDVTHIENLSFFAGNRYLNNSGKFMAGNILITTLLSVAGFYLALKIVGAYKRRRTTRKYGKKRHSKQRMLY